MRPIILAGAALAAALSFVPAAQGQNFRSYVSSAGRDANPCTVQLPCRLVNRALDATADGGEIWILDSANFNQGTVDITKSVSILAVPGEVASILAVGGTPAITIGPGAANVALRNLVIAKNVNNPGTHGLVVPYAANVSVEGCLFANLSTAIYAFDTPSKIYVDNTVFRNVADSALFVNDGPSVTIVRSHILSSGDGVSASQHVAGSATQVSVTDTTISGVRAGVWAYASGAAGMQVRIFVTRSTIQNTTYGVRASNAGALVTISGSTVAGNYEGFVIDSTAVVKSTLDNYITDNGTDIGTLGAAPRR